MRLLLIWVLFLMNCAELFAMDSIGNVQLRLEFSPVWQTVNRVQIPVPDGTRFEFTSLGRGPVWNYRFDAALRIGENSEIRALYAPLALTLYGQLDSDVVFQDALFSGSRDTEGYYRFNSYRLTYRYRVIHDQKFQLWFGFTGKIRDAEVRLTQGSVSAARANVGFVPLLHVFSSYRFSETFRALVEMDALAAPQGRAEDIGLLAAFRLLPQVEGFLGYRTVEGGSNGGGGVYTFTWLHYGVLGVGVTL